MTINNYIKPITKWILSFFLCMIIFLLSCALIISITVLQRNFIIKIATDSNYFYNASVSVEDAIINYGLSEGIQEEVFKGLITPQDIKQSFIIALNDWTDDKAVEMKIENALLNYISSNSESINEVNQNDIQSFVIDCYKEYTRLTQYDLIRMYASIREKCFIPLYIIITSLIIIILILIIILRKLNKYKHNWYENIFVSLGGAILMMSPLLLLKLSHSYEMLRIHPSYFYTLIIKIIEQILFISILNLFVLFAALLLLNLLYFIHIHTKRKYNS